MDKKTKFAVYVAEIYKENKKLTGRELEDIFSKYGVWEYIIEFYEILHINGSSYIIADIDKYIDSKING